MNFQVLEVEVGSNNPSKIKVFLGICPETLPRCPKTPPRRPQDAPRRPKDGPRPARGRARTAPRRPQTPQNSSKLIPRGARERPRRRQIRGKKRHKSDPKRNPFQISFLEGFWADFGRFSDGFGKVLGMILEAWRSIFQRFCFVEHALITYLDDSIKYF